MILVIFLVINFSFSTSVNKAKGNMNAIHSYIPYENESCISCCIMKLFNTNC